MLKPVPFYSEGVKLAGDLFLPADIKPGGRRAGIVLCHGYTGVRSIYLPDNARVLAEAGYVVLTFDYKGWGDSDGAKTRLAPYSRVADVQAALTFMGAQPEVDAARLGTAPATAARPWCSSPPLIRGSNPWSRSSALATERAGCAACVARTSTTICWTAPPRTVSSARSPAIPSLPTATTSCCRTASRPNWARRRDATIRRQ